MGSRPAFLAILLLLTTATARAAVMTYIYHAPESALDVRYQYHWEILRTALEKTTPKWGPYRMVRSEFMTERRQTLELKNHTGKLTVMYLSTTPDFEQNLIPIRIPVDKNLGGYCVFLIRKEDQSRFASVHSLDDLRHFTFGLGLGWIDVDILKASGLRVVTGSSYDGLFEMLDKKRFDIFLRAAVEVLDEYDQRKAHLPNLRIEDHFILYYPLPMYFWFPKTEEGRRLAARAEAGMRMMIADGTYDRIFDKYQRTLESWRRKPAGATKEEEDQYVADQVALYTLKRAGFNPQSFIDFWDRFTELHGKTGNWFSDFIGSTKPEQKRLREMLRSLSAIPSGCSATLPPALASDFQKWQTEVVGYRTTAAEASLPGLVFRQTLAQPLRPDITNLRFSPDGTLVLAQDDGGIHILKRDPLSLLFFIDAPGANKAFFSPDSHSVVFYTPSLRVEVWDIAKQERTFVHEMTLREPCMQDMLSPDGRTLACLDSKFALSLIDVASDASFFTKKDFFRPDYLTLFFFMLALLTEDGVTAPHLAFVNMQFSPDAHYFLSGSQAEHLGYDLVSQQEMSLPSRLKSSVSTRFAFIGNDRIASTNPSNPEKSGIVGFPSGEKIREYKGGAALELESATHGNYLVVSPLKDGPIGVLDLDKDQLATLHHPAADTYDGALLYERDNGEIALSDMKGGKAKATFRLVQSRVGALQTVAVSPDFGWLAMSTRSRGAFWDVNHNIRIQLVHSFTGSGFSSNNNLIADFPKYEKRERALAQLDQIGGGQSLREIKQTLSYQQGIFFVDRTPASEKSGERKDWNIEVRDAVTNSSIWSRHFPKEVPRIVLDPIATTAALGWSVETGAARDELRQFPELKGKFENDDYFLELVDMKTNNLTGKLVVKTGKGSIRVREFLAGGDWAVIGVRGDRVLTYSFRSGTEVGHVFGTDPKLSIASNQLAVTSANGDIQIYDLASTTLKHQYKFPIPVAFKQFSADGKRLFVLTRDQTVFVLDLSATETAATH